MTDAELNRRAAAMTRDEWEMAVAVRRLTAGWRWI